MSDSTKMIICLIGGGLITLLYKWNKEKIDQETINLAKLKNEKSIPVASLQDKFSMTDNTNLQLFVEGNVRQNTKLLKSLDKQSQAVFKRRTKYNNEIVEHNGIISKQTIKIGQSTKTTDSFRLQSHNNNEASQLLVYNFSDTIMLPRVLQKKKKDTIFSSPEVRTVMREPQNDEERAQFKQGQLKKFLTTISKIGVSIEEEVLIEGTFLCLYGEIIKDKSSNIFTVSAPKYFGESKDQIIKYLEADQYFRKFIGILLAIGGAAFLIFGITYFYQLIANLQVKDGGKKNIKKEADDQK